IDLPGLCLAAAHRPAQPFAQTVSLADKKRRGRGALPLEPLNPLALEGKELLAKVRNLPFDCSTGSQLRVNGLRLKLFSFSVRGELVEPQKNTFARASIGKFFIFIILGICV